VHEPIAIDRCSERAPAGRVFERETKGGIVMVARVRVGLLLLLSLPSCVARGTTSGPPEPLRVGSVRSVGRCAEEAFPKTLPGPAELVDTSTLSTELWQLARRDSAVTGRVVLTLDYGKDGHNRRGDVLAHSVSPVAADSVQKLVLASLVQQPEEPREWGVRLQIDLAPSITYAVAHREYCPPAPESPEVDAAMHEYPGPGAPHGEGPKERTVLVRIEVDPTGHVAGATVVKGAPSDGTLERDLVRYLGRFSFRPATLDGVPVFGTLDAPIRIPE
jgi:TonB family protein